MEKVKTSFLGWGKILKTAISIVVFFFQSLELFIPGKTEPGVNFFLLEVVPQEIIFFPHKPWLCHASSEPLAPLMPELAAACCHLPPDAPPAHGWGSPHSSQVVKTTQPHSPAAANIPMCPQVETNVSIKKTQASSRAL